MSERGVFAIDRGVFDHECFADEPFTEREAWVWLIGSAAWRAKTVRVGKFVANLKRGQSAFSVRFLADKWQWSKSRVDRFLDRLKNRDMIGTETETGITVITINNYGQYQRVSLPDRDTCEPQIGTAAGQQRDKEEDIKTIKTDSEANASGADAPTAPPIERETPEARLWRLGLTDLIALGLSEPRARSMIGSWRRDTGDDCERVLGAIMRAREYAVANPIAWITASLKPRKTDAKTSNLIASTDAALERVAARIQQSGSLGAGRVLLEGSAEAVRAVPERKCG